MSTGFVCDTSISYEFPAAWDFWLQYQDNNRLSTMPDHFQLHVDQRWSSEISAMRQALTEETGLIRFDNSSYRICRPAPPVTIEVFPGHGRVDQGLVLEMDPTSLYVSKVAGRKVERYPSTLDLVTRDSGGLDAALVNIPGMTNVKKRFPLEMLVVFCVAESLRFDTIAQRVDEVIKYGNGRLVAPGDEEARKKALQLEIGPLLPLFKNWEDASEAVFRGVTLKACQIAVRSRTERSQDDRRHHERVELQQRDLGLIQTVRSLAVLQRPGKR